MWRPAVSAASSQTAIPIPPTVMKRKLSRVHISNPCAGTHPCMGFPDSVHM